MYVLEGPAGCGNLFGFFKRYLLTSGEFAIVEDGEYANGGYGPSTVDGKRYQSRRDAEQRMESLRASVEKAGKAVAQ